MSRRLFGRVWSLIRKIKEAVVNKSGRVREIKVRKPKVCSKLLGCYNEQQRPISIPRAVCCVRWHVWESWHLKQMQENSEKHELESKEWAEELEAEKLRVAAETVEASQRQSAQGDKELQQEAQQAERGDVQQEEGQELHFEQEIKELQLLLVDAKISCAERHS